MSVIRCNCRYEILFSEEVYERMNNAEVLLIPSFLRRGGHPKDGRGGFCL